MAIVDGRTSLTTNDATGLDDLTGAAAGTTNTETFIEGTGSQSFKVSSAVSGLLYDAGSAQNWSNNHFYIWWNCSTAGKLNSLASGGVRVRFCGATVTDWFEVYIAGNDTYSGGFEMAVIDIETARANAVAGTNGGTNGTTPLTSAVRYVGIVFDVTGMISGNVDNCFIDAMWRLPASTAGIRVEGQNTGAVDWTWDDIVDAGDVGDPTKAWGTIRKENGIIFINAPIQFGANDGVTHGFSDTDTIVAWEDQLVASNFYGLNIIGGSGAQSFQLGNKSGTGDDAVGTQGGTITAAAAGQRWYLNANDANVDACNLYGCTFIHGADFQLGDPQVSVISCTFLDCTSATVSNAGDFLRCSIIDANTADGVAFITTDDLSDIVFCSFIFSDGHAIELTTPRVASQTSKGNKFTGYGAIGTNDAAIYNNTAGAVTVSVTELGDTPTYRNGTSASTTVNNTVTLTITCRNQAGLAAEGVRVRIETQVGGTLISEGTTNASGIYQDTTYNYTADTDVKIIARLKRYVFNEAFAEITAGGLAQSFTMIRSQAVDLP